jgi:ribonuclease J
MVAITIHGGANEIGGNKVLIEDRDTRVFFDFGEQFNLKDDFFVDWLKPREARTGLKDYLHFGLVPRISGLYGREWLEGTDLPYVEPDFDAIFLSHMHFDHAMEVRFTDDAIPVYLGKATEAIRESWVATAGNAIDFGEHEFRTFRTGSRVKTGSLEIEPIHVDHSVPGAYGFLIHTSEGCVAYTGDLRLHGPKGDMTRDFIMRAASERPIAMVCEGTRVTDNAVRENLSEEDVKKRALKLLSGHKKLALVSFYPKDVDRMRTFTEVAERTGRKLVVSTKIAHLLEALKGDPHISVPDPLADPNILVYVRSGMSRPLAYDKRYIDMASSCDHIVDCEYVAKHQSEIVYHLDFAQLAELIDIEPSEGSLFIRSKSEPFEEDDVQEEVLQNWIDWFHLSLHPAHASGHASMEEIFDIVREIRPEVVVPVHTEHPDLFANCGLSVKCPVAHELVSLKR